MNPSQRVTFELLIVLAVLIVFASSYGRGFWATLFTPVPLKVEAPTLVLPTIGLPSIGNVNLGTIKLGNEPPTSGGNPSGNK